MKPETAIQARIVAALRKAGYIVLRIHCGKVKVRGGWMQQNEEGTPDLLVLPRTFLETKTPTGRLSEVQERMHVRLANRGFRVFTVRSLQEALGAVDG